MAPEPLAHAKKDDEKSRAELIEELNALRTSLRLELQEKQRELDVQYAELEVQNERLRVQLEELNARAEGMDLASEVLRESEEKYRGLVENIYDWIWEVDEGNVYTYSSPRSFDVLGYRPEELLGKRMTDFMTPEETERVKGILSAESAARGPITGHEGTYVHRDGHTVWVEVNALPIFNVDGVFKGYRGIIRDITERKRAEEESKAAKAQAELYLDLMGHDINNLHQVALGYLELAKELPPGEEQAAFLDKPVEVLRRSAKLISNVRKLEKLRTGAIKVQRVDVCGVLCEVGREYGAVPGKSVALNLNGQEHCLVEANELLYEVFANLVGNAVKHTGDMAEIIVDMDLIKDTGCTYCRVMVEDNGPGIPDGFKTVIFNRTLKGTNKARGMGLGLYLVKTLVDSYGGQVWVEDRVIGDRTKGAKFVVLLPVVDK